MNCTSDKERLDRQFLIDRTGEIHKLSVSNLSEIVSIHSEIACTLFPKRKDALYSLVNKGWIVVGSMFFSTYSGKKPNQAQINQLYDLGIKEVSDYNSNNRWVVY